MTKAALLTLGLACAAPAFADVAVPQPPKQARWDSQCASMLEAAAKKAGLKGHATTYVIPLRHENGRANSVRYAEYASTDIVVTVGDEPESRPDERWSAPAPLHGMHAIAFRRLHNRFAKIDGDGIFDVFHDAAEECLKMGESK